jgi:methyl-accepting chemotaxis protein
MQLTFKQRIWAIPAIAALLFTVGIAINISYTSAAVANINRAGNVDYPALDRLNSLSRGVQAISEGMQHTVTDGEKEGLKEIQAHEQAIRRTLEEMAAIDGHGAMAADLAKAFDAYYQPALKTGKIMLGIDSGDAAPEIARMQAAFKTLNQGLRDQYARESKQLTATLNASSRNVTFLMTLNIVVAVLAVSCLAAASFVIIRLLWRQLGGEPEYAIRIAGTIADGDFSNSIDSSEGAAGSMLRSLHDMQDKLAQTIVRIRQSGDTIAVASREIVAGNTDLAARTEDQAQSLEQTVHSMRQLTATVKQNADHARMANQLAASASGVAAEGGAVVSQVVDTMGAINASSRKIVDIISVIDGIAFQTNILALNAAVEAARAGEQGRGFAVVATEVRNLAQRSASAAKEIKVLIEDSVQRVEEGAQFADRAGATMGEIVGGIQRVTDIMAEITAASQEQSAGIELVLDAIGHIDQGTQQNAALVKQAAAATQSLQDQADNLAQVVSVFKLGHAAAPHTRPRAKGTASLPALAGAGPRLGA